MPACTAVVTQARHARTHFTLSAVKINGSSRPSRRRRTGSQRGGHSSRTLGCHHPASVTGGAAPSTMWTWERRLRDASNTWALDRRGWAGLCIEASPEYATQLRQARTCTVVEAAIDWHERNTTFLLAGGYGGLVGRGFDNFRRHPKGTGPAPPAVNVTTRRLVDVLAATKAPKTIVHAVDVEGAEGRVLTPTVLSRHTILTLTVERPSPSLVALLFAHDYLFVKTVEFDGHFVHATHQARELERNASFKHIPEVHAALTHAHWLAVLPQ